MCFSKFFFLSEMPKSALSLIILALAFAISATQTRDNFGFIDAIPDGKSNFEENQLVYNAAMAMAPHHSKNKHLPGDSKLSDVDAKPPVYDVYFLIDLSGMNKSEIEHLAKFVSRAAHDAIVDGANVGFVGNKFFAKSTKNLTENTHHSGPLIKEVNSADKLAENFAPLSLKSTFPSALENLANNLILADDPNGQVIIVILTSATVEPEGREDLATLSKSLEVLTGRFSAKFLTLLIGDKPEVEYFDDITDAPCLVLRYPSAEWLIPYTPTDGAGHLLGTVLHRIVAYSVQDGTEFSSICLELAALTGFDPTSSQRFNLADPTYHKIYNQVSTNKPPKMTTTTSTTTTSTQTTTTSTTTTTTTTTTSSTTTTLPTTVSSTTPPTTTPTTFQPTTTTTTATTTTPAPTTTTTTTPAPTTTTTTTPAPTTTTTTTPAPTTITTATTLSTFTTIKDDDTSPIIIIDSLENASEVSTEDSEDEETSEEAEVTNYAVETATHAIVTRRVTREPILMCYQCHDCSREPPRASSAVNCGMGLNKTHAHCYVQRRGDVYERGCNLRSNFECANFDTGAFAQYCCNSHSLCNGIIPPPTYHRSAALKCSSTFTNLVLSLTLGVFIMT